MRRLCVLLAILVALAGSAHAELVQPPGSALALDPPDGFSLAAGFTGYEDAARGASIVLAELPAAAYATLEAGLTAEALAARSLRLLAREPFASGLGDGLLLTATQRHLGSEVGKWMLLVPAERFTALVTVTAVPGAGRAVSDAEVRTALATLTAVAPSDPAAALPFTFTETANLRLARTLAGSSAMFTAGGVPAAPGTAPVLIVAASLGDLPSSTQKQALATSLLHSVRGFGKLEIDAAADVPLGDGIAAELRAHGTDERTGRPVALVQWLIVGGKGYVRVLGIAAPQAMPAILPEFAALAASIAWR